MHLICDTVHALNVVDITGMVTGSKIDKAAHPNDVATHLREILEYDKTVGAIKQWAVQDGQTLVPSPQF